MGLKFEIIGCVDFLRIAYNQQDFNFLVIKGKHQEQQMNDKLGFKHK